MNVFQAKFDQNPTRLEFACQLGVITIHEIDRVTATADTQRKQEQTNMLLEKIVSSVEQLKSEVVHSKRDFLSRSNAFSTEMIRLAFENDPILSERYLNLQIQSALENIELLEEVKIFVNPCWVETVSAFVGEKTEVQIEVEADENLPITDCIVESGELGLISQLDHQILLVREAVAQSNLESTEA